MATDAERAALGDLLEALELDELLVHETVMAAWQAAQGDGGGGAALHALVGALELRKSRIAAGLAHICALQSRLDLVQPGSSPARWWQHRGIEYGQAVLVAQARLRAAGRHDPTLIEQATRAVQANLALAEDEWRLRPEGTDAEKRFVDNTFYAAAQGIIPEAAVFKVDPYQGLDQLYQRLAPEIPHLFENSEPMTREFLVDFAHGWFWLTNYRLLMQVRDAGHIQYVPLQSIKSYRVTADGVTTSTVSVSLKGGTNINFNGIPNRQLPGEELVAYVIGLAHWEDLMEPERDALKAGGKLSPALRAAAERTMLPAGALAQERLGLPGPSGDQLRALPGAEPPQLPEPEGSDEAQ
jgi:hypothetical protein